MKIQYFKAFSLIELVFVIVIIGVLGMIVIPKFDIAKRSCYVRLSNELGNLQRNLSFLYTKITLSQTPIYQSEILAFIKNHHFKEKYCSLGFEDKQFVARAFGEKTIFSIEPSDLSVQPSFKCSFSLNALCREILNRQKKY